MASCQKLLIMLVYAVVVLVVRLVCVFAYAMVSYPPENLHEVVPIILLRAPLHEAAKKYGVDMQQFKDDSGHEDIETVDDLILLGSACKVASEGIAERGSLRVKAA